MSNLEVAPGSGGETDSRSDASAWDVGGIQQSMASPSNRQKPRPGTCDGSPVTERGSYIVRTRYLELPTFEPTRRRRRIEPPGPRRRGPSFGGVSARIQQDISERVVNLTRRWQKSQVVAVREHAASASGCTVHRASETRRNRFHPSAERVAIPRFHDQMRMAPLEGVVHEPEVFAGAPDGKSTLDCSHDRNGAQRRHIAPHTQRDVRR